jgi:hypothetical protein
MNVPREWLPMEVQQLLVHYDQLPPEVQDRVENYLNDLYTQSLTTIRRYVGSSAKALWTYYSGRSNDWTQLPEFQDVLNGQTSIGGPLTLEPGASPPSIDGPFEWITTENNDIYLIRTEG